MYIYTHTIYSFIYSYIFGFDILYIHSPRKVLDVFPANPLGKFLIDLDKLFFLFRSSGHLKLLFDSSFGVRMLCGFRLERSYRQNRLI